MASHGVTRVTAPLVKDEATRKREEQEIKLYRELDALISTKISENLYDEETLKLASSLLQKNPEYYTIWNHRRRILLQLFNGSGPRSSAPISASQALAVDEAYYAPRIRDLITQDLQFLIPLLMKYPKCYWLWNHRLWLLGKAVRLLPLEFAETLWQEELGLVSKMLTRDRRNFHGWGYRRLVIANLDSLEQKRNGQTDEAKPISKSLLEQEFNYTTKMISSDLSNFSAWHNRSKLIPKLLNERQADAQARKKMLDAEFELAQNALLDPIDQSPWFYHQFLISTLLPGTPERSRIILDPDNGIRMHYLEQEITAIKDMLEDSGDCKWVYQALLIYSEVYLDIEAGNKFVNTSEMRQWFSALRQLDPLRKGKWHDWEVKLGL